MNILITSAGRRTSLLTAFQRAAHPRGMKVFVAEMDPLAPTCTLADAAFQVPRVTSPSYIPTLLELAKAEGIGLIVPTIDTEVGPLAANESVFKRENINILISSEAFVATCRDKWKTNLAFQAEGYLVPPSWLPTDLPASLPQDLFVKPRDGSASSHLYPCHRDDLGQVLPRVPNPIVQERITGQEITIDAFLTFDGVPIHFVPRERIRTVGGESIQGVTIDASDVDAWTTALLASCSRMGARGPITIQAFRAEQGIVLTEINPRFGGGYPLAHAAGGDYPAWILDLLQGGNVEPRLGQYRRNLYMTRHYSEIFTETLPWER